LIADSGCPELLQSFGRQTSAGIKYGGTGILTVSRFVATDNQRTVFMDIKNNLKSKDELIPEQLIGFSIKMRDAALLSAERRQVYEWKFCILIWTAIGSISIVLLIKKAEIHPNFWQVLILGVLSLVVIFVEVYFQEKCRLANQVDKRRAELYEAVINASMGIAGPDYLILNADSTKGSHEPQNCIQAINLSESKRKEVEKAINQLKDGEGKRSGNSQISIWKKALSQLKPGEGKWPRNSQILITIVLIAAFWTLYLSIQGPKPSEECSETSQNTTNNHQVEQRADK